MKPKAVRVSSSQIPTRSPVVRRALAWTVKPVLLVIGLVTSLWRSRVGRHGGEANVKGARISRREEKHRRKELWRATKAAGRRRAA